ncbi:integrase, catalytic region, zinc finger, CCHC-type containing protein [Tanacetum coccineum]
MEKLENENVSLEFQVQSLIKEHKNIQLEYQKLFDSIKKTRTQTQGEIDELIEHVNQKTYAYADVRAKNQDLLITISELKARLKMLKKVNTAHKQEICTQKAKSVLTSTGLKHVTTVRRPPSRSSSSKNSVLSNTKNHSEELEVHVRTNKKTNVASKKSVVQNKKILTNVDVKNASKAKDVFCVSCDKNVLTPCHDKCDPNSTVCFGNDHFAAITGYGHYVHGNITICHVYYIDCLGHNLFSVGQFCDGARESNLYTISILNKAASTPVCLMSKATSTKSWLWHRKLLHMNFCTINDLTKQDLVDGLPKFKYDKVDLCSTCERGKNKKDTHLPKLV